MNRRSFVAGTTGAVSAVVAGCLSSDDSGNNAGNGDLEDVEPETACETIDVIFDAILEGEYELAASFAPVEYLDDTDRTDVERGYEELAKPDEVHSRPCDELDADDLDADDEFIDTTADEFDIDVDYATDFESEIEVVVDGNIVDASVAGAVLESDGEWYGAIDADLTPPEAQAGVDLDFDAGREEFTVQITSLGNSDHVTLGGVASAFDARDDYGPNDASSLDGVELRVGDTITVDDTDLTNGSVEGTLTAIAVIEDDDIRTQVAATEIEIAAQ